MMSFYVKYDRAGNKFTSLFCQNNQVIINGFKVLNKKELTWREK
jgi:hypothetical protein